MNFSFRRHARPLMPGLLTMAWAAAAWAQSNAQPTGQPVDIRLEPVVVTPTRAPVPLHEVLADVTVIDRDELQRRGAAGVADVLRVAPGVEMNRSGGMAGTTSVFIRGGDTRFTTVLVDGVRVDSQSTGGASWQAIPLSQIDRIEILRGPASAVYGSDALSGVVHIFTRRGEPGLHGDAGIVAGAFNTVRSDAGVSGRVGPVDFAVSGQTARSDGFNARPAGNPDRDGYVSNGGSGRLGVAIGADHRVEASFMRSHVDGQSDITATDDDHSIMDLETARLAWSARLMPSWTSLVSFGQSEDRYETRPSAYLTETRVRTSAWQNDWQFGAHAFNATLEHREDRLENSGLLGEPVQDRTLGSVALGYGWRQGGRALQLNLRHDEESDFGQATTGTLAAGADIAAGWRVHASVGNAFRAPTLYQRFSDSGPSAGHAALKAERSVSNLEVALKHRAGAFDSSVTAYRNRVADLIVYGAAGTCVSTWGCYGNVGRATLQGLTFASAYAHQGLRVVGSIDLQSPKNAETGRVLARRSRRHASVDVQKELGDTTVGMQWVAASKRYDRDTSSTVLPGYAVVNLDLVHRFSDTWRLQARIDNFLDRNYQTAGGFNTEPLAAYVGVRWTPSR